MSNLSANLSLPFLQPSQAQKHVTHNEALELLDFLAQLRVVSFGAVTPPSLPQAGDVYAVGAGATDAWAGKDGKLAAWNGEAWRFIAPQVGWRATARADGGVRIYGATGWTALSTGSMDNLDHIGVQTTGDASNRLAVASPASLFTHEGAGHRMKVNKAADTDTASLLFQTGWSGRAEMGLAGDDNFSVKVSADGSSWTTALELKRYSGDTVLRGVEADSYGGAGVQADATDTTAGRLMRADYGYGPGNLLGPVTQWGGTPTGAVIERDNNANGEYVRFADGTQICTNKVTSSASGDVTWTFPAAFVVSAYSPRCIASPKSGGARIGVIGNGTLGTSITFGVYDLSGTRQVNATYLIAVGNWF